MEWLLYTSATAIIALVSYLVGLQRGIWRGKEDSYSVWCERMGTAFRQNEPQLPPNHHTAGSAGSTVL